MRIAWLLAALLTVPLAAADDAAYADRFVFEGRVIGENGLPIPGLPVTFITDSKGNFTRSCPEAPQGGTTDANGDFRFCFLQGPLNLSAYTGVVVDGIPVRKPMDNVFRRTVVLVRDPNQPGTAPDAWNDTFRIAGKVLVPAEALVDGVRIHASPLTDAQVNITLAGTGQNGSILSVRTDELGDFDATLRLVNGTQPQQIQARVEAMGQGRPLTIDPIFHRSTVGLMVEPPVALENPSDAGAPAAAPGQGASPPSPALVAGVGLAILATVAWARRKSR